MKYKTYTIEGKKFNAVDLGKELGVTQQTARNRLKVAKTIDELYRQLHSTKYKKHIIEGKEFTSVEIAKELNCSDSTARARLQRSRTTNDLLKPIKTRSRNNSTRNGRIINMNENNDEGRMRKLAMGAW